MSNFGSQIQTKIHARLATAAALATCTYTDASGVLPTSTLGAHLTASANGALTVDGVAAVADDPVLIKDQAATLQNGVYVVANAGSATSKWVLRRHRQAQASEQFEGMLVTTGPEGGTNPSVTFLYSGAAAPVIGTDAISFATSLSSSAAVAALQTEIDTLQTGDPGFGTITTGGAASITPTGPITVCALHAAGTLATFSLTLDDGTAPGQAIFFRMDAAITALTLIGTTNTEALAQPTAIVANTTYIWVWDDGLDGGTLGWMRFQ